MKHPYYILITGFIVLTEACSNSTNHKKHSVILDSLRLELDKKIAVFNSIDTSKISRNINIYNANITWMKKHSKDTLSASYLNTLKKYQTVNDPLLFLQNNFSLMIQDAEFNKQQLQKLSSDLAKKLIDEEKAFEYFTIEKMEAEKMTQVLQNNYKLAKESIDSFEKYNNEIEKLITTQRLEKNK